MSGDLLSPLNHSEQRSPQRAPTPNAFSLQSIAQYKKPCGRTISSANHLPTRAVRGGVVALLNADVSIPTNVGDASPRSADAHCSRSARRRHSIISIFALGSYEIFYLFVAFYLFAFVHHWAASVWLTLHIYTLNLLQALYH